MEELEPISLIKKGSIYKGKKADEKKLIFWIENLRLGLKYRAKLAKENGTIAGCKGLNAELSRDLGRVSAYEEVVKDLDKILKIK